VKHRDLPPTFVLHEKRVQRLLHGDMKVDFWVDCIRNGQVETKVLPFWASQYLQTRQQLRACQVLDLPELLMVLTQWTLPVRAPMWQRLLVVLLRHSQAMHVLQTVAETFTM
jgi:hypothetical protein